jgi:hypothetical protein
MTSSTTPAQSDAARQYSERERRLKDAVALRIPDRVPVVYASFGFWHAAYCGHTVRQAMYDYDLLAADARKAVLDLQPDGVQTSLFIVSALGPLLELADYRSLRWPGHGVAENASYQYIDREVMTADEYDLYIDDPTYFYYSRYLPRIMAALAPLAKLPQITSYQHLRLLSALAVFGDPEVASALQRLIEIGAESRRMVQRAAAWAQDIASLGFPSVTGAGSTAPFDYFADYLRGAKGLMLDMYRRKDKVLAALDRVTPILIKSAVAGAKQARSNICFMPMHWGLDGFMSLEQFKIFFWPQLRAVIMGLIENDVVPCVLWEGNCESRLETIADIPRGKAIYWFERTDMLRAKEVLGDMVCLRGNVSPILLNTGTTDDVTAYVRRLIEGAGKNGGLIVDGAIGISDEAKPGNVHAMFRAVREYGRYQ